jgi:hypothetical protein
MGWGVFLTRPSMRGATGGNYYQAFFPEKLMLLESFRIDIFKLVDQKNNPKGP